MDSAYGVSMRLGVTSHSHLHHSMLSPESHVVAHQDHQPDHQQEPRLSAFSVVDILRPDFGRKAVLSTKAAKQSPLSGFIGNIAVQPPQHSPLSLPRDLSLSSTRLSPSSPSSTNYSIHRERDTFSSHSSVASPVQRHNGLSRSGSLESLASTRSTATNSSVTNTPPLCSTSFTVNGDSLNNESSTPAGAGSTSAGQQSGTSGQQSLWPAWVYCTRYSDRPSSGKILKYYLSFKI